MIFYWQSIDILIITLISFTIYQILLKTVTRFFHSTSLHFAAEKSHLASLRKKTGYTFANCKKALELHNNDIQKVRKIDFNAHR